MKSIFFAILLGIAVGRFDVQILTTENTWVDVMSNGSGQTPFNNATAAINGGATLIPVIGSLYTSTLRVRIILTDSGDTSEPPIQPQ